MDQSNRIESPWLKRIFWSIVGGFMILIAITSAQAYNSFSLRERLDQRDVAWRKRLDALEQDVASLKRANQAAVDWETTAEKLLRRLVTNK